MAWTALATEAHAVSLIPPNGIADDYVATSVLCNPALGTFTYEFRNTGNGSHIGKVNSRHDLRIRVGDVVAWDQIKGWASSSASAYDVIIRPDEWKTAISSVPFDLKPTIEPPNEEAGGHDLDAIPCRACGMPTYYGRKCPDCGAANFKPEEVSTVTPLQDRDKDDMVYWGGQIGSAVGEGLLTADEGVRLYERYISASGAISPAFISTLISEKRRQLHKCLLPKPRPGSKRVR